MPRVKKTCDYLRSLQEKGYPGHGNLLSLYRKWKSDLDIKALSLFLATTWEEKDSIKRRLGENTYSNFRGIAFEEFCVDLFGRIIESCEISNLIRLFWNTRILTEEFYILENGQFRRHPKYKTVDITVGQEEGDLIHPLMIASCKIWQSTNWLDEDRAVFDNIRNRYPDVVGYCLCMHGNVPLVSLISSQRTGLKVFDFSREGQLSEFVNDAKDVLDRVKESAR